MTIDETLDGLSHDQLTVLFGLSVTTRRLVRTGRPLVAILEYIKQDLDQRPEITRATAATMVTYLAELAVQEAVRDASEWALPDPDPA